jgi:SPP1 family predicted phage head-tail adaptor
VTIEAPTSTPNELGEAVQTWASIATVWAGVRPLSSRELIAHAQVEHQVTHEVTLRYTPALTPACRFVHRGRVLQIVGIKNADERNVELRVTVCESGEIVPASQPAALKFSTLTAPQFSTLTADQFDQLGA